MKSIGQTLKTARDARGLTIDDVYRSIKVHPNYIEALERDDYGGFDGEVHSKGFLKIYAEFLGLDVSELLALWRREYGSRFEDATTQKKFSKFNYLDAPKFVITPTLVLSSTLFILVTFFFAYLFLQYRHYTGAPTLDVFYPANNEVATSDILDVTGKVSLDSRVFINGHAVSSNPDGSFLTSLKLNEGLNTLSIKAVNKLEKETEVTRTIIYRPKKELLEVKETTESTQELF